MSRAADLKGRIKGLGEIKSILGAMKSLAIIEMNKVSRFLEAQRKTAGVVEEILSDFEAFYRRPDFKGSGGMIYVLVGSERGFCGTFNEAVEKKFRETLLEEVGTRFLVVGHKLGLRWEGDPRMVAVLGGPETAEEIPGIILKLALKLNEFREARWGMIYNEEEPGLQTRVVFPMEEKPAACVIPDSFPPLLQAPPEAVYPELVEQYLFFFLYEIFYSSFMAENRGRLRHMEGALNSLRKELNGLHLKFNQSRQEAVTEELETIFLGVEG